MFSKKESQDKSSKERVAEHLRSADKLVKEGKFEEAKGEIEKALELDPRNLYARSFLERVRVQAQKVEQYAQRAARVRPSADDQKLQQITMLLRTAEQLVQAKSYKLALQQVAKVFVIDAKNYYAQAYSDRIRQLMAEDSKGEVEPVAPTPTEQPAAPSAATQEGERATLTMYRELLKEMWFDGKINSEEAQELKKIRGIFKIKEEEHAEIEKQVRVDAYVEALRIAWRDGAVSQNDNEVLKMMRERFNISMEEHMSAEAKILWAKNAKGVKSTILIVDDEKAFLLALAGSLKKFGYDVLAAESVEDAQELLRKSTPSLILADLLFPPGQLNGIEFYKLVRDNPEFGEIPFLLMSGISDEFVVRAGVRMGVDDFIQKPFDLDLLLATIEGKLKS